MSEITKVKRFVNPKFEVFKLPNKRIGLIKTSSCNYGLIFRIRTDNLNPKAIHTVFRNKVVSTELLISKESALFLFLALKNQLEKDGILTTATAPGDVDA